MRLQIQPLGNFKISDLQLHMQPYFSPFVPLACALNKAVVLRKQYAIKLKLAVVSSFKFLNIFFNKNLSWNKAVENVSSKAKQASGGILFFYNKTSRRVVLAAVKVYRSIIDRSFLLCGLVLQGADPCVILSYIFTSSHKTCSFIII